MVKVERWPDHNKDVQIVFGKYRGFEIHKYGTPRKRLSKQQMDAFV